MAIYYVSTTGYDTTGDGSFLNPYKSINKVWSVVTTGDTAFIRGGTYAMSTGMNLTNKSGTISNLIKIYNYLGESPVFDFSATALMSNTTGIHVRNVDYLHIKGIRITGIVQQVGGASHYGIRFYDNVNNSILENIETDFIGGTGIVVGGTSSNNLILNCDSHHNSDQYSVDAWGSGDGFQSAATGTNNTFRGCRAWYNSDDGYDFRLVNGSVTLDQCWAFKNGYIPETNTTAGNGEGFKLGPKGSSPSTTDILRIVTRCVAASNRTSGFQCITAGYYNMYVIMYNNAAYQNGVGINGRGYRFVDTDMVTNLRNNLDYQNGGTPSISLNPHSNNSWDSSPTITVTNADFLGVNPLDLILARQSDGNLPSINFLKPVETSDLIDRGIDVGLPYNGSSPDLGSFENDIILRNYIFMDMLGKIVFSFDNKIYFS